MSRATHQYLQIESSRTASDGIKICGHKELIDRLHGKLSSTRQYTPDYERHFGLVQGVHDSSLLTIKMGRITDRDPRENVSCMDEYEMLKMAIIRFLTEDGFKILNTVFDGKTGAEKHMMCKEF